MNSKYISGPAQIKEMILIIKLIGDTPGKYTNFLRSKRFAKLNDGRENLSDWIIKAMKGFGLLETSTPEKTNEKLKLTELGIRVYEMIKSNQKLSKCLIDLEKELRADKTKKVSHDDEFNSILEEAGIIDAILDASSASPSFIMAKDFFEKHGNKFKKSKFSEEFWNFINEKEIVKDSKTATSAENRTPSFLRYMKLLGFISEGDDEYFWTPSEHVTEIDIIENIEELDVDKEFEDIKVTKSQITRKGQTYFRNKLIKRDKKCLICNVYHPSLLVASHVKKYSNSDNKEKYDINNGITLCCIHDKLFELRFISFDKNGILLLNEWVTDNKIDLNIHQQENNQVNFDSEYFDIHRSQFNERNK